MLSLVNENSNNGVRYCIESAGDKEHDAGVSRSQIGRFQKKEVDENSGSDDGEHERGGAHGQSQFAGQRQNVFGVYRLFLLLLHHLAAVQSVGTGSGEHDLRVFGLAGHVVLRLHWSWGAVRALLPPVNTVLGLHS